MRRRLSLGLLCLTLAACARQADIIVTGGMVWTGLSNGAPQKGALALANGKILAVGDSAQIARYAGPKTQTIQADELGRASCRERTWCTGAAGSAEAPTDIRTSCM